MFYDSHAHFEDNIEELKKILSSAQLSNVTRILAVGGDDKANQGALSFSNLAPDNIKVALGYEMDCASDNNDATIDNVKEFISQKKLDAIGEIGLDFYYSKDPLTRKHQIELFALQLELASKNNLPVSVHTREADDEMIQVIDSIPAGDLPIRGSIHCFTGSVEYGKKLLDRGFCLGISGIVTFNKGENVRDIARMCPIDRILIETDAPFLAPVPYRGRKCESAFVVETAKMVAKVRNCSLDEIAQATYENASKLFG